MNSDIGSRIDYLINKLGIKKVRFAERLGIDQSYVTQLTNGRRNPSDLLIGAICREFNVNEKWLRTGEGDDPFIKQTREEEIAAIVNNSLRGDSDFRKRFISVLTRMTPEEWNILEKIVLEMAGEIKNAAQEKEAEELALQAAQLTKAQSFPKGEPDTQVSSVKESGAV